MVASSRRLAILALLIARSSAFSQASRFGRTATVRLFSSNVVEEMRAGEIKKELESYGISTKSFLEKGELVDALLQARAEGKIPKASPEASTSTSASSSSSSSSHSSTNSSSSSSKSRDERLTEEMEACKAMKAGELKKELEDMGISTKSLFEKAEFIKALATARVDGVAKKTTTNSSSSSSSGSSNGGGEGYAEYKNVEVLTDDRAGPRKKQSDQPQPNASPFGGGGMPGGMGGMGGMADILKNMGGGGGGGMPGGMGGMGGIADILKNMGGGGGGGNPFGGDMMGKAQEMLKNPKVREIMAKAQSNPKVMAAVQECMSNPAAFAKYQNDPEVGGLINELKKYIM